MRNLLLGAVGIGMIAAVRVAAIEPTLDAQRIQDAIAIGQSSIASDRTRFHDAYRVTAAKPPVDYIEVVTPFRRVEQAAEARRDAGDRTFGQRQARESLQDAPDRLDVIIELTFHPLNNYVGVPDYAVFLVPTESSESRRSERGSALLEPGGIERIPRFGPRVSGQSPSALAPPRQRRNTPGQPVLGGTLVAHFDARDVDPSGAYDVLIGEHVAGEKRVNELARVRIDLSRMR